MELRDSQSNLVCSLASTATEPRLVRSGPASGSASTPDSLNPTWTKLSSDRTKLYTVTLHLDFTQQQVQHLIASPGWSLATTRNRCEKYGVTVADVFGDTALDTRGTGHRVVYTFNGLVNGYPGTDGTGTHPNLAGITSFYVPTLTSALVRAGGHSTGL